MDQTTPYARPPLPTLPYNQNQPIQIGAAPPSPMGMPPPMAQPMQYGPPPPIQVQPTPAPQLDAVSSEATMPKIPAFPALPGIQQNGQNSQAMAYLAPALSQLLAKYLMPDTSAQTKATTTTSATQTNASTTTSATQSMGAAVKQVASGAVQGSKNTATRVSGEAAQGSGSIGAAVKQVAQGAMQGSKSTADSLSGLPSNGTTTESLESGATDDRNPPTAFDSSSPEAFVQSALPTAQQWALKTGVPPEVWLAIAASESNWGKAGYALFGIKGSGNAGSLNSSTWESVNGQRVNQNDDFATYRTPDDAFSGFWDFVNGPRYKAATDEFQQTGDWQSWLQHLNEAGYATDPNWSSSIGALVGRVQGMTGGQASAANPSPEQSNAYTSSTPYGQAPPGPSDTEQQIYNQFDFQKSGELTPEEAVSACGPVAAMAFAKANGRTPTAREAVDLARRVGWTAQSGMAGPDSEVNLLSQMGVQSSLDTNATEQSVAEGVKGGNPIIISTPNHYFVVDSYNPQSREFHAGGSGVALRNGSEWLTWDQINQRGGGIQGAISASAPTPANTPSTQGWTTVPSTQPTETPTATPTVAPTQTITPPQFMTPTVTATPTITQTPTATPTQVPSATATNTPFPTATGSPTPTATVTPSPMSSPTTIPTRTPFVPQIETLNGRYRIAGDTSGKTYASYAEAQQAATAGGAGFFPRRNSPFVDTDLTQSQPPEGGGGVVSPLTTTITSPQQAQAILANAGTADAAGMTAQRQANIPASTSTSGELGGKMPTFTAPNTTVPSAFSKEQRQALAQQGQYMPPPPGEPINWVDEAAMMAQAEGARPGRQAFLPGPNGTMMPISGDPRLVPPTGEAGAESAEMGNKAVGGLLKFAATGEGGAGSGGVASAAQKAPIFYSQLQRTLEEKMPNRASPDQILGLLRNSSVKPDEIKWTGLDEFLAQKAASGQAVTKAEVQDFLRQNEVQVQEVMKGDHLSPVEWRRTPQGDIQDSEGRVVITPLSDGTYRAFDKRDGTRLMIPDGATLDDAKRYAEDLVARTRGETTKYSASNLNLPGGQNYRELLLTLPVGSTRGWTQENGAWALTVPGESSPFRVQPANGGYQLIDPQGLRAGIYPTLDAAKQGAEYSLQTSSNIPESTYRSGHWDEPNILAHVRFDDRTDADGKKVLFLQEMQSDWGHDAATKGVVGTRPQDEARIGAIDNEISSLQDKPESTNRITNLSKERANIAKRLQDGSYDVPDAPFATSENKWSELAMKRMVRYAADNGYDRIGWTTGEQQADRYDLSRQIDSIGYQRRGNLFNVTVWGPNGEEVYQNQSARPEELRNVIGNELVDRMQQGVGRAEGASGVADLPLIRDFAQQEQKDNPIVAALLNYAASQGIRSDPMKTVEAMRGTIDDQAIDRAKELIQKAIEKSDDTRFRYLEDLNLKTGGEGKNRLYDQVLPSVANQLGKKFGVRTGETQVQSAPARYQVIPMNGQFGILDKTSGRGSTMLFPSEAEAQNWIRNNFSQMESVHYIDVPDTMKQSVQQGQPLFVPGSVGGGAVGAYTGYNDGNDTTTDEQRAKKTVAGGAAGAGIGALMQRVGALMARR